MSLPAGFQVRIADGVLRADRGRLLVGGSPLTALGLSERAWALLQDDVVTVTDDASRRLADRLLATNLGQPALDSADTVAASEVTVVIPVRDRHLQLERALAALSPLRCVVVDDASLEPTAVAEVAHRHGAELVSLSENVGPAAARNAGLARVTTTYVAFVDSDVTVTSAALLRLARHFSDPAVVLVGPRVGAVPRSVPPRWFERYDAAASSLALGRTPGSVRPGAAVAWLPSACLVALVERLGDGFDETMRVGEDVDLVWRLVDSGGRVRYDPTVEAEHDARPTMLGWLGRKFVYGTGGADLAARHGNKLAPAALSPTYAVGAGAVLLRGRWSLPAAGVALIAGTCSVRRVLPDRAGRTPVAARVAVRGLGWAVRQESALLLRHWWPLTAIGVVVSRNMRRAVASAFLVDLGIALLEHRDHRDPLDLPTLIAGRRLDDLAYGAGLWWGALRRRSVRVLLPRRPALAR